MPEGEVVTQQAETPVADPTTKIEAPAVEVEKTEAPEVAEAKPEAAAEAKSPTESFAEGDDTDEAQPKKNIPGSQRLKRRLQLIESEHNETLRALEETRRQLEARSAPSKPDGKPGIDREPTEADFPNDWFAFERAKTAWDVRQSIREEIAQERNRGQETRQLERRRELLLGHEENTEIARERIPDFDKVVSQGANIPVKPELAEELLASDKSALLQYYLAKNPDKVRELNGMSGKELAREIGRLESRVHLPTAKKATEAAPPPKEIKGGAAPTVDPQSGPDDMNAYVAWRKKNSAA